MNGWVNRQNNQLTNDKLSSAEEKKNPDQRKTPRVIDSFFLSCRKA